MRNPNNSHTGIGGVVKWVRNVAEVMFLSVAQLCFSFSFTYRWKAKLGVKLASAETCSISWKYCGLLCKSTRNYIILNKWSLHQDFKPEPTEVIAKFSLTSAQQAGFCSLGKDDARINEVSAYLLRTGISLVHLTPPLSAHCYRAETRQHWVDRSCWALQCPAFM